MESKPLLFTWSWPILKSYSHHSRWVFSRREADSLLQGQRTKLG